jgi:predicted GNAT family acetyltransferase
MADAARIAGRHNARDLVPVGRRHGDGTAQPAAQIVVLEFREARQLVDAQQMQLHALVAKDISLARTTAKGQHGTVDAFEPLLRRLVCHQIAGKLGQSRDIVGTLATRV